MSGQPEVYNLPLSEGDSTYLKHRILSKTTEDGDCLQWGGEISSWGYGVFRFTFAKKRYKVKVHRFLYFLSSFKSSNFDPIMQVSHICHNKLCVNLSHLSLEDAGVNNQRKICFNSIPQGCIGHGNAKDCIFK